MQVTTLTKPNFARAIGPIKQFAKRHSSLLMAFGAFVGGIEVIHSLDLLLVPPAMAIFFSGAESFITNVVNTTGYTNGGPTVTLMFNVLRGLFLLYTIYTFVQVIKSARDGEDWQATARTPLIVVLSGALADLITTMITTG